MDRGCIRDGFGMNSVKPQERPVYDWPYKGRASATRGTLTRRAICGFIHYCGLRFSGLPIASRKIALFPSACGEKKLITSSSKKVSPVAPSRCA